MRIVLIYAQYDNKPVMEFFAVMQAFFDPSQVRESSLISDHFCACGGDCYVCLLS